MADRIQVKAMDVYRHEGIHCDYTESDIVIIGVPYDGTVSFRPGTRFGPGAVRQALDGLETYSPYLDMDMTDYRYCDVGDLPLPFGNTEKVLGTVADSIDEIITDGKKSLVIGGEHLISYPVVRSYLNRYPDLHIIHLDAHADLREDYIGESLSHATVMKRIYGYMGSGSIWQFGIRSGTREEFDFGRRFTNLHPFDLDGIAEVMEKIGESPVYLTVDLDVLDPSVFSGTGTPEPGGITFKELLDGLMPLKGANIVGADIMELSPHYDTSDVSTAVACKVLRELLLLMS